MEKLIEAVSVEHGIEVIIFDVERLTEVVKKYSWDTLEQFLENKTFDAVEYILNYYSDTIIDMYKKGVQ